MNQKEITKIKEEFDGKDIITNDKIASIQKQRNLTGTNRIILAELFVFSHNILSSYSYFLEDEQKELREKLDLYLEGLKNLSSELGLLLEEHETENDFPGEKVKDLVSEKKEDIEKLVNLFFEIFVRDIV